VTGLLLRLPVALMLLWAGWSKLVPQPLTARPVLVRATVRQNHIAWVVIGISDCVLAFWVASGAAAAACALSLVVFLIVGGVHGIREIEAHGTCGCGGFEAHTPRRLVARNLALALFGVIGLMISGTVDDHELRAAGLFLLAVTTLTLFRGPITRNAVSRLGPASD